MSRKKTLSWSLSVSGVLLLAALAFCCKGRSPEPEHATAAAASGADAPAPEVGVAPSTPNADAGMTPPGTAAPEPPVDNPVAHSMATHDARDRALLAELERTTRRAPPADVHALIALRHEGKSDAELEQFITAHFGSDLAVRAAAMRWLKPDAATPAETSTLGQGGNPRRVQPLKPSKKQD